jgi:hypothetical protein
MNFSWLSLVGGGITAAATLSVGVSMSGLLAPSTDQSTPTPIAETIYVEQPVIEVPADASPSAGPALPPIVIAILPPVPAAEPGTSAISPPAGAVVSDPVLPPPTSGGNDDGDDDSGGDHDGDGGDDDGGDDD